MLHTYSSEHITTTSKGASTMLMNDKQFRNFMKKVIIPADQNGCWLWHHPNVNGYGKFRIGDKMWNAHKAMYLHFWGAFLPLTEEFPIVEHICPCGENSACINPAHLRRGNHKSNFKTAVANGRMPHAFVAGRTAWNKGIPMAEETKEKIRAAARKRREGAHWNIYKEKLEDEINALDGLDIEVVL